MNAVTGPAYVLVGPPGAGKSSVGRKLASRLDLPFRDTDADVEAMTGQSISEIFIDHGEQRFRALERDAVATALAEHVGVLSLGGGAILDPTTRQLLADVPPSGAVVFLDVSLSAAARRTGMTGSRPLLLGNTRAQLKNLMDQRRPLYEAVSSLRVDTSDIDVRDVVAAILVSAGPVSDDSNGRPS